MSARLIATVFWTSILVCQVSLANEECRSPSLAILLTNDDGVMAIGIEELHRVLVAAGHNVKRIAPDQNYSGTSSALTLNDVTVEDISTIEFPDTYSVGGTPATSVVLGATAIYRPDEPMDLIVSGINNGPNVGAGITASGTVGAVLAGLNLLYPAVPGIAISTSAPSEDRHSPEFRQHFANVAQFVSRVIDVVRCDDSLLLGRRQALNINYPPLHRTQIRGIRLAEQGHIASRWLGYNIDSDGKYDIRALDEPSALADAADISLFERGYITIAFIDGEYVTVPQFNTREILAIDP